jgi:hypothetical protein
VVGGGRWVVGGALVIEGEEVVKSFREGVFSGDAVAGQGVEAGDVSGDRASCECFGVKPINRSDLPDRRRDGVDAEFLGEAGGLVFGAEGFEDGCEFGSRGRSEIRAETVLAGVAAGRSFPAGAPRSGAVASVGAVGGDAGGAGGHDGYATFGTGCACLRRSWRRWSSRRERWNARSAMEAQLVSLT